jgi:hypothetical protein
VVWEIFGGGAQGTVHASVPANTTEKATEDEGNQAERAQILSLVKSRVVDAAYSRIARQEEDGCGDHKRSWAPRIDDFPRKGAAHVHTN